MPADELLPNGLMALVVLGAFVMLQPGNGSWFQKSEKSRSTGGRRWRMLCQSPARRSDTVRPSTARAGNGGKGTSERHRRDKASL